MTRSETTLGDVSPGTRLDPETSSALQWQALLSAIAALCSSSAGQARARALEPAPNLELALARNRVVAEMLDLDRLGLAPPARAFADVSEALERAARGGVASAAELWQVRELLELSAKLRVFADGKRQSHPALSQALDSPAELTELEADLAHALAADGTLADRASPELARARKRVREMREAAKRKLGELLERHADVVQADYYTEREGRYVLPVRSDAHLRVPGIVVDASASGATLFVEPVELTGLGNQLRIQEAEALREATKVLAALSGRLARAAAHVRTAQRACVEADLLGALARFARVTRAVVLPLVPTARLQLKAARHPLLALASPNVVASDISIQGSQALVISGPNAGGKTVALKTLGLVAWMARAGVPLTIGAESSVGWFECVLADIGDDQSIDRSLSTFSAHVRRLAALLQRSSPQSLVLVDELASGTDPEEGAALAAAVLEALTARGAAVAVTTHYEKLKDFATHAKHLLNASVSYDFERLAPTFRLTMGVPAASSALSVATTHGLPSSIVERAKALLPEQSLTRERAVAQLERQLQGLERQREALAREADELRLLRERLETERESARIEFDAELARETLALRSSVSKVRAELLAARERLKREGQDTRSLRGIERDVSRAAAAVSLGGSLVPRREAPPAEPGARATPITYRSDDSVRVKSSGLLATVIDTDGDKLRLQVGSIKLIIRRDEVEPARAPPRSHQPAQPSKIATANLPTALRTPENTLDLRGERVDDGLRKVDAFLDQLLHVGESVGFILHGHGTGALKSAVRSHLCASSYVEQSQAADVDSGGDAFTTFWLRC